MRKIKARVIGTQEWKTDYEEVFDKQHNLIGLSICNGVRRGESLSNYTTYPLYMIEFYKYPQWEQYFMECAKEFVQSILSNSSKAKYTTDEVIWEAFECARLLYKELKSEE